MEIKDLIYNILTDKGVSFGQKQNLVLFLHKFPEVKDVTAIQNVASAKGGVSHFNSTEEMGVFGNVWVRKVVFEHQGQRMQGHKHHHDHITLLASGSVMAYIEEQEPKRFTAPTFITVKAEHEHHFVPLEDKTVAFCVFALRDDNGEVTDFYNENNGWQYGAKIN